MADVAARIRQLQQRVRELTNYLNNCIRQANALRSKKSQLEHRLRELDDIRKQATNKLNGSSDDAHDAQAKLKKALGGAVGKSAHTGELEAQVSRDMEPSFSSSTQGWEAVANIDREIARVQQELDETMRQINVYDSNARTARNNIQATNTNIRTLQKQANG